jgi:hypothetical protein
MRRRTVKPSGVFVVLQASLPVPAKLKYNDPFAGRFAY